MNSNMDSFVEQVVKTLESNGFPDKRVSLPTDKMFDVADRKGLSFNQVLEILKDRGIDSEMGAEKIIFSKEIQNPFPQGFDPSSLKDMDQAELMKKAQEFMSSMSPEQMAEVQKMYQNMSDEEKAEIMKKGKEMGLV